MKKKNAMIVTPQPEASEAGAEILKAGGNAVDAAIAIALVQGVVDPMMAGISGFGSMGIYLPKIKHHSYIDFHSPAPASVRSDMWESIIEGEARDGYGFVLKGRVNDIGYQSICVPASLKAYFKAHSEQSLRRKRAGLFDHMSIIFGLMKVKWGVSQQQKELRIRQAEELFIAEKTVLQSELEMLL